MAKKTSELPSLGRTVRVHMRALALVWRRCPGLIPCLTLSALFSAVLPYITVFLSAQILTELAGARRPDVLIRLVCICIFSGGLLTLLKDCLSRLTEAKWDLFFVEQRQTILGEKSMSMDFVDKDDQKVNDLLTQIRQNANWRGYGLYMAIKQFSSMIQSLFGIISAAILSAGLFFSPVPLSAGAMTALDSPLILLGWVACLALILFLRSALVNRSESLISSLAQTATLGNRLFGAFGFLHHDSKRALDLRVYNQFPLAEYYMKQNDTFTTTGLLGKLSRGGYGILASVSSAVSALLTGSVYVFVGLKAWAGAFDIGAATQYIGAITALTGNLSELLASASLLRSNTPFLEDFFRYLDIPNSMYQGSLTTEKRADRQYEIEFRDVSFRYPGSETYALRHVNMKFRVGSRLAVVGENGSGKTTFIKLLCRLYDPQEGQILLNGIDIRKYNYRDYMEIFSVVFQDFQLLSQSIGSNVAGSIDYDPKKVEQALRQAGFGERLSTLPKGLDTAIYKELDPEGIDVSGGEAQKIAIARALYKDAPFIILDEPTAALDPLAEAEIYSRFNEIASDRTAIYISHRLSSCKFCDEIAVFDHGKVVQQGSHQSLLADKAGKYYALWHAQAQYYT